MAVRTVKARVELDGEKQYKQALSELNQGNKVLASEMRKLQAEYKGNADSAEFLTKKGDLLQRQLLTQQEKVNKLKEALQASAQKYGEADKRTQDWIVKLNNAEAAQYDLEHSIEENNKALQGQDTEMKGLGDTVQSLAGKFGIQLPEGATKALNGMKGFSAGTVTAMAGAAAAVAAVIKVVKELGDMTLQVAHDVDELVTESMTTGLSTQTIQGMQYAQEFVDVSVNTITGSLTKLTSNMAKANEGNQAMADSFAALGVSIVDSVDGSLRPAEEVFYELIDALGNIPNETERDAVAMELFGKSAQELNPLILQGSDVLKQYAKEAQATGYVLDEEQIQKLAAVDDAYHELQLTIEANRKQLAAQFAPAAKEAMELFSDVVSRAGKALIDSGILENFSSLLQVVVSLGRTFADMIDSMPSWLSPIEQISNAFKGLAVILATITDALNVIRGLLPWNWGSGMARTALGMNAGSGSYSNLQKVMGYDEVASGNYFNPDTGMWEGNFGHNAGGTASWRGGLTWVGESGAELVALPRGSQIYSAQDSKIGGDTFYITIDAASVREFNDIVEMAQSARVQQRMR